MKTKIVKRESIVDSITAEEEADRSSVGELVVEKQLESLGRKLFAGDESDFTYSTNREFLLQQTNAVEDKTINYQSLRKREEVEIMELTEGWRGLLGTDEELILAKGNIGLGTTMSSEHGVTALVPKKELEKSNATTIAQWYSVEGEYSFYEQGYEENIKSPKLKEYLLPNMYSLFTQAESDEQEPDKWVEFINTLGNKNPAIKSKSDVSTLIRADRREKQAVENFKKFFKNSGATIRNLSTSDIEELSSYKDFLVPESKVDRLAEFNRKRRVFPMYVNVAWKVPLNKAFANMLSSLGISDWFLSVFRQALEVPQLVQTQAYNVQANIGIRSENNKTLRYWNLESLLENSTISFKRDGFLFNPPKPLAASKMSLLRSLLLFRLRDYQKQKQRVPRQILNGTPAYSEVVAYRLVKIDSITKEELNSYTMLTPIEESILNIVDTQVKYGKEYTYKLYSYSLVFGDVTNTREVDSRMLPADIKAVGVRTEPAMLLYEHELFTERATVLDDPPIRPDYNIIPYPLYTKVKFSFSPNVGRVVEDPIIIEPSEQNKWNTFKKARGLSQDDPVQFSGDDSITGFVVYRLEEQPRSYEDFAAGFNKTVRTSVNAKKLRPTSASMIEDLEVNKKYYYTFRCIDVHGNMSNPTEIVEVELVEDSGVKFLLNKVVDFATVEAPTIKTARRYLHIKPNALQTTVNEEESGFEEAISAFDIQNDVKLGIQEDGIWGKKFKVRVTSRSTGKKIDIMVGFRHLLERSE